MRIIVKNPKNIPHIFLDTTYCLALDPILSPSFQQPHYQREPEIETYESLRRILHIKSSSFIPKSRKYEMHLRFYISSSKSNQEAADSNRQLLWVDTCDQTRMGE